MYGKLFSIIFLSAMVVISTPPAMADEAAFVGMQVQGVSEKVAEALGLAKVEGVLVLDLSLGGPADKAGVQRGDLILKFAGQSIDTFDKLLVIMQELKAGDEIAIDGLRGGKPVQLKMTAGSWQPSWRVSKGAFASLPTVGITFSALTPKVRESFNIRWGATGLLVTLTDPTKAENSGIQRGDVIYQVNQELVWQPARLVEMYTNAKKAGRPSLMLLIEGVNGFRYAILKVK